MTASIVLLIEIMAYALYKWPSYLKKEFLDLLFPVFCLGCKADKGVFLCGLCRKKLQIVPPTCFVCKKMVPGKGRIPPGRTCSSCQKESFIYAFISPLLYDEEVVRDLIHNFKYNRVRALSEVMADLLGEYFIKFDLIISAESMLVPIPLYPGRKRVRGFNQSELIARCLAEKLGLRIECDVLRKIKKTKPQMSLPAVERRKNIVGTFSVDTGNIVKDKTVFLLDDVKTTGATLEEAAKVLAEAGAKYIWAVTLAH